MSDPNLTLPDRSIAIVVTTASNWGSNGLGANVSYEVVAADPKFPNAINKKSGNIYLSSMKPSKNFSDNLDITLILNAQMTDQAGNEIFARWALPDEGSFTYPKPEGFCWFCANDQNTSPIATPPGFATIRNSDTVITIDDNTTDDFKSYTFCMGLVVPPVNGYFITIEPVIVSKGTGLPPPPPLPV